MAQTNGGSVSSEKRKPGWKGNFHGECLQLLESFLPKWEKARLNRTTGDFWSAVTSAYWERFHWHQQNEDPSVESSLVTTEAPNPPPMDENLTADKMKLKATTIRQVETVRGFFILKDQC